MFFFFIKHKLCSQIPAAKQLQFSDTELNKTVSLNIIALNETVTLNESLPLNETVTLNSIFTDTTSSNNISYKRTSDDTRTDLQCSKLQKLDCPILFYLPLLKRYAFFQILSIRTDQYDHYTISI